MPSLPPTLPSLRTCSHASHLPRMVVVLPLVLSPLSFSSRHHLLSVVASTCPPLIAPLPPAVPLFISGVLASRPPWLFVLSPLITLLPPVRLHLPLSLHHHLSLHPSCVSCLSGCCIASHHTNTSRPLAPLITLTPPICQCL
jgi:hypothetical protein